LHFTAVGISKSGLIITLIVFLPNGASADQPVVGAVVPIVGSSFNVWACAGKGAALALPGFLRPTRFPDQN